MKFTPPKKITFWITVALVVIGLIAYLVPGIRLSGFSFWFVFVGYVLLALALLVKGL